MKKRSLETAARGCVPISARRPISGPISGKASRKRGDARYRISAPISDISHPGPQAALRRVTDPAASAAHNSTKPAQPAKPARPARPAKTTKPARSAGLLRFGPQASQANRGIKNEKKNFRETWLRKLATNLCLRFIPSLPNPCLRYISSVQD